MTTTLTYQQLKQPDNWLYEIKQKGNSQTCYVMVQNVKDLVKSHLMFAVREEVEVLKEKIAELMDRINQLEVENTILKANASQETLSQLTTAAIVVTSPLPPSAITAAVQQQLQNNASSPALNPSNEQVTPAVTQNQQAQQPTQPQATPMTQQQQQTSNSNNNPPSQPTS